MGEVNFNRRHPAQRSIVFRTRCLGGLLAGNPALLEGSPVAIGIGNWPMTAIAHARRAPVPRAAR
jgi:hypothetical protein